MARQYLYKRHRLPIRITHWVNVLVLTLVLMSGLQIFNAHPSLYWGKSSYTGAGPILDLHASGGFPWWATIPGQRWLAMGRRWHFFFAWLLVINGVLYLAYSFLSRHVSRDLVPTRSDWRSIGRSIVDHLLLRHPQGEAAKHYNVLQKLAYLALIFVVLPLIVLTGLSMSPWLNSLFSGWVDIFGGRQSARTIHFIAASLIVLFVLIHVFEVIVTGFWNNLRSMITGNYRVSTQTNEGPTDGTQ